MRRRFSLTVCSFAIGLLSGGAAAGKPDAAPDYAGETLTGDWNGRRTEWSEAGAKLELGLKSDWLHNRGGESDGGGLMSQFDVKLSVDLEKLLGWTSTRAFVHFLYDRGNPVNINHTHSLIGISNIEWPIDTTRFFQAWVERSVLDDTLGVLVGLYPFDSEFSALDSGTIFLNPSFGASPDVSLTRGPSIFNNSSFGVRLKWESKAVPLYVQAAVLDGIPGDPTHPQGTHIKFARGDGSFHIFESGTAPDGGQGEGFSKVAVGYWGYTARVDDLADLDADGSPVKRRSSGWYALGEQTVWRGDNDASLAAFARYCATDGNSTAIDRAVNLGLRWRAPLQSRPGDVAGIAVTRAHIGGKYRRAQAVVGIDTANDESILELTYRAPITRWLAVQPVVQRLRNPGALNRKATVVGMRLEVAL